MRRKQFKDPPLQVRLSHITCLRFIRIIPTWWWPVTFYWAVRSGHALTYYIGHSDCWLQLMYPYFPLISLITNLVMTFTSNSLMFYTEQRTVGNRAVKKLLTTDFTSPLVKLFGWRNEMMCSKFDSVSTSSNIPIRIWNFHHETMLITVSIFITFPWPNHPSGPRHAWR